LKRKEGSGEMEEKTTAAKGRLQATNFETGGRLALRRERVFLSYETCG
jgi:hypothetical protein